MIAIIITQDGDNVNWLTKINLPKILQYFCNTIRPYHPVKGAGRSIPFLTYLPDHRSHPHPNGPTAQKALTLFSLSSKAGATKRWPATNI